MRRLVLSALLVLLTASAADASDRRPVRRVAAFVVMRPLAGLREPGACTSRGVQAAQVQRGRTVFRSRTTQRFKFAGVSFAASDCSANGCPIPARGK